MRKYWATIGLLVLGLVAHAKADVVIVPIHTVTTQCGSPPIINLLKTVELRNFFGLVIKILSVDDIQELVSADYSRLPGHPSNVQLACESTAYTTSGIGRIQWWVINIGGDSNIPYIQVRILGGI